MQRIYLGFSDPKIEKEYNKLKELNMSQDQIVTMVFLLLNILANVIDQACHGSWLTFSFATGSLIGLIMIGILFRLSNHVKRHVNFLNLMVIYFFIFTRVIVLRDLLGLNYPGGSLYLYGFQFASIEFALLFRLLNFRQQIIGLLIGFILLIGIIGWIDPTMFQPEILIRQILLEVFIAYTFYFFNKKERQIFLAFYEYRESLTKFKELLSDYLPQSITVLNLEGTNTIFSNKAFSSLFIDSQKVTTQASEAGSVVIDSHNEGLCAKIDLDSLEIDIKTVRELGKSETCLDLQTEVIHLRDIIQKITSACSSKENAENAWTLAASYTHGSFHKSFEVILKMIKWDKEDAVAIIFNDITYQENLIALKAADENKNKILSTVSHELRTPLNAIIGILQICEKKIENNPEVLEHIELCQDNAHLLLSLVNSLLDLQQISQGKLKLNPSKIEVRKMLGNVLKLFQFQARRNKIQLNLSIADDVPEFINNDESRIKQILINLLGNAFKFTFQGSITLNVTQDPINPQFLLFSVIDTGIGIKDEDKDKLFKMYGKLEDKEGVNKNGVGLGLTIANSLSAVLSGQQDGRGIQLESKFGFGSNFSFSILKDIVTPNNIENLKQEEKDELKNNGVEASKTEKIKSDTVSVGGRENITENEMEELFPFANSKFTKDQAQTNRRTTNGLPPQSASKNMFEMSIKKPSQESISQENSKKASDQNQNGSENNLETPISITNPPLESQLSKTSPDNILIVDDNPFNLLVAENLLTEMGYQTQTARGGKEAIDIIKTATQTNQVFKIILMDCQMPVMDGYEATRILKDMMEKNEIKRMPIIALTANTDQRDIERCYECGMDDFLSKPLLKNDLSAIIHKVGFNNQNEDH